MTTDKDFRRCLNLLAMCSSEAGDGTNAAEMLQSKMKSGVTFGQLYSYAHNHNSEFQYIISHFHQLRRKAERIWKEKTDRQKAEAEKAYAQRFDPNIDPGPDWTWVNGHTKKTKDGFEYAVRGHWRNTPRKKPLEEWRYDPSSNPGPEYEWIAEYSRWCASKGKGKMISVRGHWRLKLENYRKAA